MLPTLETDRLILRPFELSDASEVQRLAGHIEIAQMTLSIPHPYPDGGAEIWIRSSKNNSREGNGFPFAVVTKDEDKLIGCISLNLSKPHRKAELGYWLGKPYWGQGYSTEAARRVLSFGFQELGLNKIYAIAMVKNPASANVMKKLGMKWEGELKEHILKWDVFEDIVYYGIRKSEYESQQI
ncbi:GNAT family N-acetyltransferase [Paenibacillus sp. NPDC058174]|uniref:GNAT family N-acetyltransferase n=1 Tax=Paenibacillus sp. NPDC058174 TaxID=3346366 RepID=UPI0036DCC6C5